MLLDRGQRVVEPLEEQAPVGQAGQLVVQRTAGELVLEGASLGDVAQYQDRADVRTLGAQRRDAVGDVERLAVGRAEGRVGVLGDELALDHAGEVDRDPAVAQRQLVAQQRAEDLVVAVAAEHVHCRRVGEGHPGLHVERDDSLALRVGDRTQSSDQFGRAQHVAGDTGQGQQGVAVAVVPLLATEPLVDPQPLAVDERNAVGARRSPVTFSLTISL